MDRVHTDESSNPQGRATMTLVQAATQLDGTVDLSYYAMLRARQHMVVGTGTAQPKKQVKSDQERVKEIQKGQRHLLPR